ncbi:MAG: 2-hydroxyacid dehydrogenase [Chloroflexota bacterium]
MSQNPSIAFADVVHECLLTIFREELPDGFTLNLLEQDTPAEKVRILESADFAMVWAGTLPPEAVSRARQLRLIQMCGQGLDHIPVDLAKSLGIPVANAGGTNSTAVAEMALLLMLAVYRRLIQIDSALRNGRWLKYELRDHFHEIESKTVGIVGLGTIGKKVAQRLTGFECQRIYTDVIRADRAVEQALGVEYVPLNDLLAQTDILTLHVPLTGQTRGMIDAPALARLKPSAIVVNTSRGPVVDQAALYQALVEGRIAGAGLDVFEQEPATDMPLLHMDQVVLSPHIAGGTIEAARRTIRAGYANIVRVHSGQPPLNAA